MGSQEENAFPSLRGHAPDKVRIERKDCCLTKPLVLWGQGLCWVIEPLVLWGQGLCWVLLDLLTQLGLLLSLLDSLRTVGRSCSTCCARSPGQDGRCSESGCPRAWLFRLWTGCRRLHVLRGMEESEGRKQHALLGTARSPPSSSSSHMQSFLHLPVPTESSRRPSSCVCGRGELTFFTVISAPLFARLHGIAGRQVPCCLPATLELHSGHLVVVLVIQL